MPLIAGPIEHVSVSIRWHSADTEGLGVVDSHVIRHASVTSDYTYIIIRESISLKRTDDVMALCAAISHSR